MTTASLLRAMQSAPLHYATEAQLQEQLATALTAAGFAPVREVVLSDGRSRIDIAVGRVGIEVKVAGSRTDVLRQLARYARDEQLDELILVTTKASHHRIPASLGGKPLTLCSLVEAGL